METNEKPTFDYRTYREQRKDYHTMTREEVDAEFDLLDGLDQSALSNEEAQDRSIRRRELAERLDELGR